MTLHICMFYVEEKPIQEFSDLDLEQITSKFVELIGVGQFGKCYKGSIDGAPVVVKVLHEASAIY